MDLNELSSERKEILRKLSEMSTEDLKAIDRLVERHDPLLKMLKRQESWQFVMGSIKTAALWISVVLGVIYMGLEKFKVFLLNLIGG